MEQKTIKFGDLSISLKILVVLCWFWVGIYTFLFSVGFIQGLLGI